MAKRYEESIDPLFLFRTAGAMVGTVVIFFLFFLLTGSLGDLVLVISAFFLIFLAMIPFIARVRFVLTDSELHITSTIYNKSFKLSNIKDAGTSIKWKPMTRRRGLQIKIEKTEEDLVSHLKRKLVHTLSPTKSGIILMDGSIYSLPVKNPQKFFKELKNRANRK